MASVGGLCYPANETSPSEQPHPKACSLAFEDPDERFVLCALLTANKRTTFGVEPAVMMATLQVHEAMGLKVEREAVATLVLPQLWSMSVGPLLSVGQFERFMQYV